MIKNSTIVGKCILMLTIATLTVFSLSAQTVPKLKFRQPQLIFGTDGQINAIYKFPDVTTGVDAYVRIENIANGAYLINIDDSTMGYDDAWQPTVGSDGQYGSSYIKWDILFTDKNGRKNRFSQLDATAIDIDGDNARVREFIGVNGQSSYTVPTQIPTLLTITNVADTDNINDDKNPTNLIALGPVTNRVGVDTLSQDVRIAVTFLNTDEFHIYTGTQIDSNGNTGGIAPNRYHCIYFQKIIGDYGVLPVKYESFNAFLNDNKVNLSWTTAAEIANDHFEVERSFDQTNFSTAAIILGAKAVNNGVNEYSFADGAKEILNHKIIYYRLKQVDADGNYSYSSVKIVRINAAIAVSAPIVQVMPNPYMDKINVNFESDANGTVEIKMLNVSGSVVKKISSSVIAGKNNVQLQDLYSQAPGMYVVNITVNGKVIDNQKVIKN